MAVLKILPGQPLESASRYSASMFSVALVGIQSSKAGKWLLRLINIASGYIVFTLKLQKHKSKISRAYIIWQIPLSNRTNKQSAKVGIKILIYRPTFRCHFLGQIKNKQWKGVNEAYTERQGNKKTVESKYANEKIQPTVQ